MLLGPVNNEVSPVMGQLTGTAKYNAIIHSLYAEHSDWLKGWLRKKLGCSHQAADMAHDTFVRVISAAPNFTSINEPRAYLTTVAGRLIIDQARRKKIEQNYLETWLTLHGEDSVAPSSQDLVEVVELLTEMAILLEALPEKPRKAFIMSRIEGQTYSEIAECLGVSVSMIKKYMAKAILHCFDVLNAEP